MNDIEKFYVISNHDVNQIAIGLETIIPYAIVGY